MVAENIPGQTSLYTASDQERLHRLGLLIEREDKLYLERQRLALRRREVNDELCEIQSEMKLVVRGNIQRSLLQPVEVDVQTGTERALRDRRKQSVVDRTKQILVAAGGRMLGKQLASLLGVDSHGLDGLIRDAEGIVKEHDGREKNEQTWYRLGEAVHA